MLLGSDRGTDSGGPAGDEQGNGHSGNAGAQGSRPRGPKGRGGGRSGRGGSGGPTGRGSGGPTRRGNGPALRPRHDHTEPGYTPPVRVPPCLLLAFLREFYPRSLEITVMKKPLSACSVRWAYFYGR